MYINTTESKIRESHLKKQFLVKQVTLRTYIHLHGLHIGVCFSNHGTHKCLHVKGANTVAFSEQTYA